MSHFFAALTLIPVIFVVVLFAKLLLRARKNKPLYGQTMENATPPEPAKAEEDAPYILSKGKRTAGISFLSVWIIFWSFGVYLAMHKWLTLNPGDQGYIFLAIWLAAAIPAWFFVAWTIFRLLRGDHVEFEFDGDGDSGGGD